MTKKDIMQVDENRNEGDIHMPFHQEEHNGTLSRHLQSYISSNLLNILHTG